VPRLIRETIKKIASINQINPANPTVHHFVLLHTPALWRHTYKTMKVVAGNKQTFHARTIKIQEIQFK
jgi:hypothetical protein